MGHSRSDRRSSVRDAPRAAAEIAISADGRGRRMDNLFIERLWRG